MRILFINNDLEINLNKFESGESNVLLITGFSGSGKSTLAKQLANKYNCIHYELDCLDFYLGGKLTKEDAIGNEDGLVAFIDSRKLEFNKSYSNDMIALYRDYLEFLINWCKKQKDKKFIIEGLQIHELYQDGDTFITSCPIIIKGTSGLVSAIRGAKRNEGSFIKEFSPLFRWAIQDNKKLNKLVQDMKAYEKSSFAEEFSIYESMWD